MARSKGNWFRRHFLDNKLKKQQLSRELSSGIRIPTWQPPCNSWFYCQAAVNYSFKPFLELGLKVENSLWNQHSLDITCWFQRLRKVPAASSFTTKPFPACCELGRADNLSFIPAWHLLSALAKRLFPREIGSSLWLSRFLDCIFKIRPGKEKNL